MDSMGFDGLRMARCETQVSLLMGSTKWCFRWSAAGRKVYRRRRRIKEGVSVSGWTTKAVLREISSDTAVQCGCSQSITRSQCHRYSTRICEFIQVLTDTNEIHHLLLRRCFSL
jgi:hypothetical protein